MADLEPYIMVLTTTLANSDGTETEYAVSFDVVTENSVDTSIAMTTQPMVSGDQVADHMYREPTTMSVSGAFSLNGHQYTAYSSTGDRLANIQEFFENVQKQGALCKLSLQNGEGSNIRFKQRDNMVLKSINWTQGQNYVTFRFSFTEVIQVEVGELEYDVDVEEEGLPSVTDVTTLDFTDDVLDFTQVDTMLIKILLEEGLVTSEWLTDLVSWINTDEVADKIAKTFAAVFAAEATVALLTIGTALVPTIISGVTSACIALGVSVPGVGFVVGTVIAVVGLVAWGIYSIWSNVMNYINSSKYSISAFTDDTEEERLRFMEFIAAVHLEMDALEDAISVYGFSTDEPQQCLAVIDDTYYVFTFTESNLTDIYKLVVTDIEGNVVATMPDITAAPTSLNGMTDNNYLFVTSNGTRVYLANNAYSDSEEYDSDEYHEIFTNLTNYIILTSQISLSSLWDAVADIIKEYIYA